jgi:transcriptional regulator with XRE-family HTH domain
MTFAERLKFARLLTGLSARRLAELAGVSPGYPGHLESGRRQNPPSAALSDIARVLGTTMDWLLNGAGAAPTEAEANAAVAAAEAEFKARPTTENAPERVMVPLDDEEEHTPIPGAE